MRTDTTARDVMHREFLGVSESDPLRDAAALLVDEGTNCPSSSPGWRTSRSIELA